MDIQVSKQRSNATRDGMIDIGIGIQALVQVTKRHTFFQQLPIEAVEQLCGLLKLKKFPKSSVIFKQGTQATRVDEKRIQKKIGN